MVALIQRAVLAELGTLRSLCSAASSSKAHSTGFGTFVMPTSAVNQTDPPGMARSTLAGVTCIGGDVCRIPIKYDDSKVVIYIMADSAAAVTTGGMYPQLAIRLPNHVSTIQDASPAWGVSMTVGASTAESGWKLIKSTAISLATTTGEMEAFIAGPFESYRYAMNFGPTSTGTGSTAGNAANAAPHYIEKYQNYMEVQMQFSSVLSTGTWLKNTTNNMSTDGSIYYLPIEIR